MPAEVETMAYVYKTEADIPWHRLGNPVSEAQTADEMVVAAEIDWEVETRPVLAQAPTVAERNILVPDAQAVVRVTDGKPLGVVGSRYEPVQNRDVFGFIDALVDSGDAKFETAGSLRDGRIVWMLARIDRDLRVADETIPYLLGSTSHDGSSAVQMATTPVRVICANTHRWALNTAVSSWSVRHTKWADRKVQEAREALRLAHAWYDEYELDVDRLMHTPIDEERFIDVTADLFPIVPEMSERQKQSRINRRMAVTDIYFDDPTVRDYRGTGWGVVNAANSYELWHSRVHGDRFEKQAIAAIKNRQQLTSRARELVLAGSEN